MTKTKQTKTNNQLEIIESQPPKLYANTSSDIIQVTEDKLRLTLHKYDRAKQARSDWTTPLSIFLTFLLIFPTTDTKDWIFDKEVWIAIFILSAMISFVLLCRSVWIAVNNEMSIEDTIVELKPSDNQNDSNK